MAQKKEFRITTPRGSVFTSADANGSVTAKIEWAPGFAQRKAESFSKAQQFVDSECLRYMNPLTPRRTGFLIKSGTLLYQVIPLYQATKYIGVLVVEFNPSTPNQIKIVQSTGITSNSASNGIRNIMGRTKLS